MLREVIYGGPNSKNYVEDSGYPDKLLGKSTRKGEV